MRRARRVKPLVEYHCSQCGWTRKREISVMTPSCKVCGERPRLMLERPYERRIAYWLGEIEEGGR